MQLRSCGQTWLRIGKKMVKSTKDLGPILAEAGGRPSETPTRRGPAAAACPRRSWIAERARPAVPRPRNGPGESLRRVGGGGCPTVLGPSSFRALRPSAPGRTPSAPAGARLAGRDGGCERAHPRSAMGAGPAGREGEETSPRRLGPSNRIPPTQNRSRSRYRQRRMPPALARACAAPGDSELPHRGRDFMSGGRRTVTDSDGPRWRERFQSSSSCVTWCHARSGAPTLACCPPAVSTCGRGGVP